MTTAKQEASESTVETPWYDLIPDPEPPEDAMQQDDTIHEVMSILKARYENDPTVLWSTQSNVIYDSDVPGSYVAPDGFIVFGVVNARTIKRDRRSYRIAEWDKTPGFILEVASGSTAGRDLNEKREIYARMGAQEYWRLDRRGLYYSEPLVGERLVAGVYQPFQLHTDENGDTWSRSEVLGVDFVYRAEEENYGTFLLRDSTTGEWLNTLGGERAARQEEASARQEAEERSEQAETRIRELEAEIERLRSQQT